MEEKNDGKPTFFSIHARIGRLRYLAWYFVISMPWWLIGILDDGSEIYEYGLTSTLLHFVSIPLFLLPLFFSAHRLRDMGRSAWFLLFYCLPFLNIVLVLVLLIFSGDKESNQYDAPPPPNSVTVKILAYGGMLVVLAGLLLGKESTCWRVLEFMGTIPALPFYAFDIISIY